MSNEAEEVVQYERTPWYAWLLWFALMFFLGSGFWMCTFNALRLTYDPPDAVEPSIARSEAHANYLGAAMFGGGLMFLLYLGFSKPARVAVRKVITAGGFEFNVQDQFTFCRIEFIDEHGVTFEVGVEMNTEASTPTERQCSIVISLSEGLPNLLPKVLKSIVALVPITGEARLGTKSELYVGITEENPEFDFVVVIEPGRDSNLGDTRNLVEYVARIKDWEVARTTLIEDGHPHTSFEYLKRNQHDHRN